MIERKQSNDARHMLSLKNKLNDFDTKEEIIKNLYQTSTKDDLQNYFSIACANNDLEAIKILIHDFNVDIKDENCWGLCLACSNAHLNIIEYLTSSPDIKDKIDPSFDNWLLIIFLLKDDSFTNFSSKRTHDQLKSCLEFFLNFSHSKKKLDIHYKNDYIFKQFAHYKHYNTLKYIINEYNIDINENIQKIIDRDPTVKNLFDLKKLNNTLSENLDKKNNNNIKQKNKI